MSTNFCPNCVPFLLTIYRVIPANIDMPQERDIINVLDILERKPEPWHEVLGEKTLRSFRNSVDKSIKKRGAA